MSEVRCLDHKLALLSLAKLIEVCNWKVLHVYLLSFAVNGPDQETAFIFYSEFHVCLNSSITLAIHALLVKSFQM